MNIIKKEACFTINNCDFVGIQNFRNKFLNSEKCKVLSDSIQEMNVIVKVNGIEIKSFDNMPLIVFGNDKIQIRYDDINKIISIDTKDYESQKDLLIRFLDALLQFKIQDTSLVTFRFVNDCDNGNNKLQIFTQNMNNFPNWIHNEGFEVKIPINIPNTKYNENYRILKVQGGETEKGFVNYIYRVVGNYKYSLDESKVDIEERIPMIQEMIQQIPDIYNKFIDVCNKTMEL